LNTIDRLTGKTTLQAYFIRVCWCFGLVLRHRCKTVRVLGENSVLGALAASISDSLTHVLRWIYWWHSTDEKPDLVSTDHSAMS